MKIKISYTVDATYELRKAIGYWGGSDGLATPEQVRAWYETNGRSLDEDLAAARAEGAEETE